MGRCTRRHRRAFASRAGRCASTCRPPASPGSPLQNALGLGALLCAGAALVLGAVVATRPPSPIDLACAGLRGEGVDSALFFTRLGRWPSLVALSTAAVAVTIVLGRGTAAVAIVIGAQALSQVTNALLKRVFRRIRPSIWVRVRESDLSYPSGHAVSSMVLFAGLTVLAWQAPLPRPVAAALAAPLAVCVVGVPWSRLALGAHYLTDVVGGLLFGAAWLCAAFAVVLRTSAG